MLAEDDLQEIARAPPRFRIGFVVILLRDAAAIVALPILPPNEQCADVDRRHRCRRGRRTQPLLRRRRDDRAEEDPVRQVEEGVVQAALGVGAVASVALLLLRHLCCHRRRR